MNSRMILTALSLIGLSATACNAGPHVGGDWQVSISVVDANGATESFAGSMEVSQLFNGFEGEGSVNGVGGATCIQYFDISGSSLDDVYIPTKLKFTTNSCTASSSLLSGETDIDLYALEDGDVLTGHRDYIAIENDGTAEYRMYFSASSFPY
ncbi:MAG: hypothetical protein ACKO6N_16645 [Myxococcota bacterium]